MYRLAATVCVIGIALPFAVSADPGGNWQSDLVFYCSPDSSGWTNGKIVDLTGGNGWATYSSTVAHGSVAFDIFEGTLNISTIVNGHFQNTNGLGSWSYNDCGGFSSGESGFVLMYPSAAWSPMRSWAQSGSGVSPTSDYAIIEFGVNTPLVHVVSGAISSNTTWHTGRIYKISRAASIDSGITLTVEPGAIVKFATATSSLTINGTLNAIGSVASTTYFTSLHDDLIGGDTNGNATSTSPNANDWELITIGSGGTANFGYAEIRYGGANSSPMIHNNGGTLTIATSTIRNSAAHGIKTSAGTTTVTNSDVAFNDYGLYLAGGSMSITASSTIHNNTTYGAFNNTSATSSFFAENNYWATGTSTATSGPYHVTLNPGGTGDSVSSYIDFDPWIGKASTTSLAHYVIEGSTAVQPGLCNVPYHASTTYATALTNAVNTWNAQPRVSLAATSSTSSIWTVLIYDVNKPYESWRGQTSHGYALELLPSQATSTVELNTYYLDNDQNTSVTQKTVTHELGHVLGLDHSFSGNVMYAHPSSQTALGDQDLIDYDYQWGYERDWTNVCL